MLIQPLRGRSMNRVLLTSAVALVLTSAGPIRAAPRHSAAAGTVTRLADAFVAEYKRRLPIQVMYTGARLEEQTGLDINGPAELAHWRQFVRDIDKELGKVPEGDVAGQPEWVTRAYLVAGIATSRAEETCRGELWNVGSFGWVFQLPTIVDAQPVATAKDRREALIRWHGIVPWLDQDVANLKEGLRQGYAAYRAGVVGELSQIESFIAAPYAQWPTTVLAKRAKDAEFTLQLNRIAIQEIGPAAKRYRDFLKTAYLPHARATPSTLTLPDGMACLRARLSSSLTVDMDPRAMFDTLVARRKAEHARILALARQAYADPALTWETLGEKLRADPRDKFASPEDVRQTYEGIIARARQALPRMVLTPPTGDILVKAGSGTDMFSAEADDGTHPATFLYAGPDGHREVAESLAMHETIPGHYLQDTVRKKAHAVPLHPIARVVMVLGPMEGWATYAESWAAELGLYSGPFDEMGGWVNSLTPLAVAELGMQVAGWSEDQAGTYLRDESAFDLPTGDKESVAAIVDVVGWPERYPIGAMQYDALRKRAEEALGTRFDPREYHQMLLSDGPLPFRVLNAKVEQWISARR
jgi:uncharacterized protein (DUF885 family)